MAIAKMLALIRPRRQEAELSGAGWQTGARERESSNTGEKINIFDQTNGRQGWRGPERSASNIRSSDRQMESLDTNPSPTRPTNRLPLPPYHGISDHTGHPISNPNLHQTSCRQAGRDDDRPRGVTAHSSSEWLMPGVRHYQAVHRSKTGAVKTAPIAPPRSNTAAPMPPGHGGGTPGSWS